MSTADPSSGSSSSSSSNNAPPAAGSRFARGGGGVGVGGGYRGKDESKAPWVGVGQDVLNKALNNPVKRSGSGAGAAGGAGSGGADTNNDLMLRRDAEQWTLTGAHVAIGRHLVNDIKLPDDPEVSRKHCVISNGVLRDLESFNGTYVNEKKIDPSDRVKLKGGDKIKVGTSVFLVESGSPNEDDMSRTKLFPGMSTIEFESKMNEKRRIEKLTVEEMMNEEFAKIVGHDAVKKQLRKFYKKVQLDRIREENGRLKQKSGVYHMIFAGPPGTGKTSMANLVARIMLKMQLVASQKVVFVNNSLELLAGFAGQTAGKVDSKVAEAKGGVLFIDEAYSIVKSQDGPQKDSFGKEAIETIMKHLDPPSCVFVFAGYTQPMNEFLRVNEGLARRIPYRYTFEAYTIEQLVQICKIVCSSKGELLEEGILEKLPKALAALDETARTTHNAGLISNLVSFAQIERDRRIDIDEAIANPQIAGMLTWVDFEAAFPALVNTFGKPSGEKKGTMSRYGKPLPPPPNPEHDGKNEYDESDEDHSDDDGGDGDAESGHYDGRDGGADYAGDYNEGDYNDDDDAGGSNDGGGYDGGGSGLARGGPQVAYQRYGT